MDNDIHVKFEFILSKHMRHDTKHKNILVGLPIHTLFVRENDSFRAKTHVLSFSLKRIVWLHEFMCDVRMDYDINVKFVVNVSEHIRL